jgi:hypothetical protein
VLRLARHYTGLTLAERGCEMGAVIPSGPIMEYAAVSHGLRCFEQKNDPRSLWDARNNPVCLALIVQECLRHPVLSTE